MSATGTDLDLVRARRAEIAAQKAAFDTEDAELAITERTLARLRGSAPSYPPPPASLSAPSNEVAKSDVPAPRLIPEHELADAAKLPPVTEFQWKILSALIEALAGSDRCAGTIEIADRAGIDLSQVGVNMAGLIKKGYVRNVGSYGSPHYLPSFFGAVVVERNPAKAREEATRRTFATPIEERPQTTQPRPEPRRANGARAEIAGDPAPGRSAADNPLDPKTYLIQKGHTVVAEIDGRLRVDGRLMFRDQVLAMVNKHRADAELDPITEDALA